LFKDDPAEEAKTEEKEENEFEDDSEESAEENLYHDDLRRQIVQERYTKIPTMQ